MIKNQTGSTTFLGVTFLFLFAMSALIFLQQKMRLNEKSKAIAENYLCIKEYLGEYREFENKIKRLNYAIFLLNTSKKASLVIPGYGLITSNRIAQVERLLTLKQDAHFISYMNYLVQIRNKRCHFSINIFNSPCETSFLKLKRNQFNQVITRENEWKVFLITKNISLIISHTKTKDFVKRIF